MPAIDAAIEKGLFLQPRGEVGELCIARPGVAAGYLGRPELTAEKFLPDPWAANEHQTRLYRTGDLAPIFAYHFFTGDPGDSVLRAIAVSIAVFVAATLLEFALAIDGS